jgi:transposase-like protein
MPAKRHTPEQIITKLREAEVLLSQGATIPVAAKQIGITEQTFYRWRTEYGGMKLDQAKRLKDLEAENARLKRIVADQALDISILKEVASGNF